MELQIKPYSENENYLIYSDGRIFSKYKNDFLSFRIHKGYYETKLRVNGKRKDIRVNKIIAETFIDNPNNYPYVNHKDENKLNNNVENLEWCTPYYNANYGNNCASKVNSIPIVMLDKDSLEELKIFYTAKELNKYFKDKKGNKPSSNVNMCIRGKSKTAYGYKWKYKGE